MTDTEFTMTLDDAYGVDNDAAENGKWFELRPGLEVCLRRFNSKASRDARVKFESPYTKMYRGGQLPEEILEKVTLKQIAEAIIVDWRGKGFVDSSTGDPLPCTYETALDVMMKYPDFRDDIITKSMAMDEFRAEAEEVAKGN